MRNENEISVRIILKELDPQETSNDNVDKTDKQQVLKTYSSNKS